MADEDFIRVEDHPFTVVADTTAADSMVAVSAAVFTTNRQYNCISEGNPTGICRTFDISFRDHVNSF